MMRRKEDRGGREREREKKGRREEGEKKKGEKRDNTRFTFKNKEI